jgi:hypothetical protein
MAVQKLNDHRFHLIAKALADPRRYDLLRRIGKAGDTLACKSVRGSSFQRPTCAGTAASLRRSVSR